MRKILFLTLAALFLYPADLPAMSRKAPASAAHPAVAKINGSVFVKGRGQSAWEPLDKGSLILQGDLLLSGPGSRARLVFLSGRMELYEKTVVRIPSLGRRERQKDIREVEILEGSAYLDVSPSEGLFLFRTPNSRGHTGRSVMTVSNLPQGAVINVYDGKAAVAYMSDRGQKTSMLVPGSILQVATGNARGRISLFDPRTALETIGRNGLPSLDLGSGLPVSAGAAGGPGLERMNADPGGSRDDRYAKSGNTGKGADPIPKSLINKVWYRSGD